VSSQAEAGRQAQLSRRARASSLHAVGVVRREERLKTGLGIVPCEDALGLGDVSRAMCGRCQSWAVVQDGMVWGWILWMGNLQAPSASAAAAAAGSVGLGGWCVGGLWAWGGLRSGC
jgi:hypothetical protein